MRLIAIDRLTKTIRFNHITGISITVFGSQSEGE
nr:MAG TPA: hypothetical protein [Caudoviricetes sp.]